MGSKSITIRLSGRFKKDLKRYKHDAVKVKALGDVIKHLKANGRVPLEYNPLTSFTASSRVAWSVTLKMTFFSFG